MSALQADFGTELILDLHGCDPATIRSRKKIDTFVRRLCRLIKMKRYGEPDELIGALLLLCAPIGGQFITGTHINVDGGFTAAWF